MKSLIIGILLFPLLGFAPAESVSTVVTEQSVAEETTCKCPASAPNGNATWYLIPGSVQKPTPTCMLILRGDKKGKKHLIVEIPARCD